VKPVKEPKPPKEDKNKAKDMKNVQ
jgi:hypothetical protein